MEIEIERSGPVPIYRQISDWMYRQIADGAWPERFKLPAETELAEEVGVSRGTLRKAINELIDRGLLVSTQGLGTFVASRKLEQPLAEHLVTFSEDLISRGIPFQTNVLQRSVVSATARIAAMLGISEGDDVFFLKRVRLVDGRPIILLHNYVCYDRVPGIEQKDFEQSRLFELLEETYSLKISWGRRTFSARAGTDEAIQHLNLSAQDPVMYVEQLVYLEDASPIELSELWIRGQDFYVTATVKRGSFRGEDVIAAR